MRGTLGEALDDGAVALLDAHLFGKDEHYVELSVLKSRFQTDVDRGLSVAVARERMDLSPNLIPSPQPCPQWMCCLLPWLRHTQTMRSYQECIADSVLVLRDGKCVCTDPSALVRGDLISLERGSTLPADCRLVSGELELQAFDVDNCTLSCSAQDDMSARDSLLNARNMLFAGSLVLDGTAKALVVNTGPNTLMAAMIDLKLWPPRRHLRLADEYDPLLPV